MEAVFNWLEGKQVIGQHDTLCKTLNWNHISTILQYTEDSKIDAQLMYKYHFILKNVHLWIKKQLTTAEYTQLTLLRKQVFSLPFLNTAVKDTHVQACPAIST
jgi:hypothetical protein